MAIAEWSKKLNFARSGTFSKLRLPIGERRETAKLGYVTPKKGNFIDEPGLAKARFLSLFQEDSPVVMETGVNGIFFLMVIVVPIVGQVSTFPPLLAILG